MQGCDNKPAKDKVNEMIEIPVYEAKCANCAWHMTLMNQNAIQNLSEDHMMATGHVVDVQEVV